MLAAGLIYAVRGVDDLTQRYVELFLLVVPVALAAAVIGQLDQALAGQGAEADRVSLVRGRAGLVAAAGLVAVVAVVPTATDLGCKPGTGSAPVRSG